ncbi:MAG TPA: endo-1,4-beta-xylanase [Sphingomonas sp.]|nr:endo-1,4-beta-xylanase [Sphingomonas sp.]
MSGGGLTRRESLAVVAGLAVGVAAPAAAFTAEPQSLQKVAAAGGRRFGSCFKWGPPGADLGSFANPHYAELLIRDCGLLVPENELKWQALRPAPDRFAFARFDAMLGWAEAHGFAMRGHNLLWNQPKWMPAWERSYDFGAAPSKRAAAMLTTHIRTVCDRYGTRIGSYDVVNETVDPKTGGLHETNLSRAIGGTVETVDLAFRTAREAAPHAELVYNDYMSWEPGNERHRAGVLKLLETLKARGTPVDALGVQSHIATAGPDVAGTVAKQEAEWRRFLDAVVAMGLKLVVTEFDVHDNGLPPDVAVRDRAVADYARAYLDLMLSYPALRDVLAWGMSDRYTWLDRAQPRTDGRPRRACPYDDHFRAKPLREAIAGAPAGAPRR